MEATYKLYKIDIKEIGSIDLQEEINASPEADWEAYTFCEYNAEGVENQVRGEILYSPSLGRAGIAYGGDASWTDCVNEDDAMQRFFQINQKEMRN